VGGGVSTRPRLGFVGLGWIGRARLQAVAEARAAEVVAVADPDPQALAAAREIAPGALPISSYDELLRLPLDGVVIATPSGQHAEQCVRAFELGLAVFCQKPLGRNAAEVSRVLQAARRSNQPLGVDFSYRETAALKCLQKLATSGELGEVYAIDAVFHNAYGPDRAWTADPESAGGGCLVDLGVHLLDAALGLLPEAGEPIASAATLFNRGAALRRPPLAVEDFALAQLTFPGGATVRLACSWRSSFGAAAAIRIVCSGTAASAAFENVDGSFYDFRCELYRGTERSVLVSPPDAWGGRTLLRWVSELERQAGFSADPRLLSVARQLDLLYGREPSLVPLESPAASVAVSA
jgi:predicted dehydrogenase